MTHWNLSHRALSLSVAAVSLAACGALPLSSSKGQDDMQPPISAPNTMPQVAALAARAGSVNYKVLYSFGGSSSDGASPHGGLIDVGGTLYGTTVFGGTHNNGTVFSLKP